MVSVVMSGENICELVFAHRVESLKFILDCDQGAFSLEYFYQNLLKSNSVWPCYGWWKTGIFYFYSQCRLAYMAKMWPWVAPYTRKFWILRGGMDARICPPFWRRLSLQRLHGSARLWYFRIFELWGRSSVGWLWIYCVFWQSCTFLSSTCFLVYVQDIRHYPAVCLFDHKTAAYWPPEKNTRRVMVFI